MENLEAFSAVLLEVPMLNSTQELLETARRNSYAIGAFNVYNLEGVKAVINAAESLRSPAMLQLQKYCRKRLKILHDRNAQFAYR